VLPLTRRGHVLLWGTLALAFALFYTRGHPERLPGALRGLERHVSNASLSYIILILLCVGALRHPRFWRIAVAATVAFLAVNVVVESFVTILNTPDPLDLIAGVVGSLLAFGVAVILRTWCGLVTTTRTA
jgi:hypothetical protein